MLRKRYLTIHETIEAKARIINILQAISKTDPFHSRGTDAQGGKVHGESQACREEGEEERGQGNRGKGDDPYQ